MWQQVTYRGQKACKDLLFPDWIKLKFLKLSKEVKYISNIAILTLAQFNCNYR